MVIKRVTDEAAFILFRWVCSLLCSYYIPNGCGLCLDLFFLQKDLQGIAGFLIALSSPHGWALLGPISQPYSWVFKVILGRLMLIFTPKSEQPTPFSSRGILQEGDNR